MERSPPTPQGHDSSDSEAEERQEETQLPVNEGPSIKKKKQRSGFERSKTTESQLTTKVRNHIPKSSKHPHTDSEAEESETEARSARKPLGTVYLQNQKQNRLENHPNLSGRGSNKKKRSSSANKAPNGKKPKAGRSLPARNPTPQDLELPDDPSEATEMDESHAKSVLIVLQGDYTKYQNRDKSTDKKGHTAMEKEVLRVAKKELFKMCKAVDDATLWSATEWVRNRINPQILQGLPEAYRQECNDVWDKHYSDLVRQALNERRNYVQQEVRKVVVDKFENVETREIFTFTPNDVLNLIHRNGLGDEHPNLQANQAKMDAFVDQILPKLANSDAWGENYRHTTPMYRAMQETEGDKAALPCVSFSDLAYTWALFKNYEKQWDWEKRRVMGTLTKFPNDHEVVEARGNQSYPDPRDPKGKRLIFHEKHPETEWTKSEGGRCQYGGWSKKGIKECQSCLKALKKDAASSSGKKRFKKADEDTLERLRILHNRAAVEEKRRNRGRKNPVVEAEEESDFEDELEL